MCGFHAAVMAVGHPHGGGAARAQREQGRPRSRQAAAQRAGIRGRALDRGQPGHERRAARLGDRVLEGAGDQREVAAMQSVTSAPRFAHWRMASASGTVVAEQRTRPARSRSRGRDAPRPPSARAGTGSRMTSGGSGRRTSTKPPHRHGATLSACAEPAPSRSPSSAHAMQRVNRRRGARAARRPPRPRPRRSPRCRPGRSQAAALSNGRAPRRGARRAPSAEPAPRPRRCFARRRAAAGRRRRRCPSMPHARSGARPSRHLVAGRLQGEAEDVESAGDVRHRRGREGGGQPSWRSMLTFGRPTRSTLRIVGIKYSRNARSKSYAGLESPVGARGRIVHVRRPRVDDALPLGVDLVCDRRIAETPSARLADVGRRRIECADIVRRAREVPARRGGRASAAPRTASGIAMNGIGRVRPDEAVVWLTSRRGVDHLRRVVRRPARRQGRSRRSNPGTGRIESRRAAIASADSCL